MVDLNSMDSRARRSEFLGEVWRLADRLDLSVEEVLAALSTESDRLVQRLLRNAVEERERTAAAIEMLEPDQFGHWSGDLARAADIVRRGVKGPKDV